MDFRTVLTTCPYCAVGCNLILEVLDGQLINTLPAKTGPSNQGSLCIKGWNVHEFVQHNLMNPVSFGDYDGVSSDASGANPGFFSTFQVQVLGNPDIFGERF